MFRLMRSRGKAVAIHLWHVHGVYLDHPVAKTFCPRRARIWVLTAAILASSMGFMDRINISIAMPMLRADLGSTLAEAQWISNSYLLLMSSLILMCAAFGERFGLRRIMGAGVFLFTFGALSCALAAGTAWLIGARVLQGIGAALMVPSSLAIIAKAYPREERGKAIGIWAAASSLLLVVGPVMAGFVITAVGDAGWRILFALNLPLGAAALFILWLRVPADPVGEERHIDLPGGLLATGALFLIAFGLTGSDHATGAQTSGRILLFGGAGALVLAAFIWWESRAREPLVPLALFSNKSFSGANAVTFLNDVAISANLFFLPMAVITGWGETAASVSALFLPLPILLTLMSEPCGQLADRIGPAPLVMLGSVLVAVACAGLAMTAHWHDLWAAALPLMSLMALGQGLLVSPLSTAVMTSEDDRDAIVGSGVNNAISRSAWLLSVAAMGGVAAFVFDMNVVGTPADVLHLSFGAAPETALPSATEAIRVAASDTAYAAIGWITAALVALSAVIAGLTLEWKPRAPVVAPN
jgi:EmrB/QacA subfamily drug resistance transporter